MVHLIEDDYKHVRALRLQPGAKVDLCDGRGGLVSAVIGEISQPLHRVELVTLEDLRQIDRRGTQWEIVVACGSVKGGRADWLVEKAVELGASGLTPLQCERSPRVTDGRTNRWQRLVSAACKQSLRTHSMALHSPIDVEQLAIDIRATPVSFLASQGGVPLLPAYNAWAQRNETRTLRGRDRRALLIVGPEGDFTEEEKQIMEEAGATRIGLGTLRLRVETAAMAALASLMVIEDGSDNDYAGTP